MSASHSPPFRFKFPQDGPPIVQSSAFQPQPLPHSFTSSPYQEDESYYFQYLIILVENTLFKVPRHHFEDSPIFGQTFTLPSGSDTPPEGNTNDRPLRLEQISKHEFSALLKVICPKHFIRREKLSYMEWVAVLKLSTMWDFEDARKTAIEILTTTDIDPINRIELTRMYDVPQWYWPAIRALCNQTKRLDDFDVKRLGSDFSMRIAELRGQIAGYKWGGGWQTGAHQSDMTIRFIQDIFEKEIKGQPVPEDGNLSVVRRAPKAGNRAAA